MKVFKNSKFKFIALSILSLLLISYITILFFENRKLKEILIQRPTDIQIVNITGSQAYIYWKSKELNPYDFRYKKGSAVGEYKQVEFFNSMRRDIVQDVEVYSVYLEDLNPNTEYIFQIVSEDMIWEEVNSFTTKAIEEEMNLPEAVVSEGGEMSLLLIDNGEEKLMVDTQYHGTFVFDSKGREYTVTPYATYISGQVLGEKLSQLLVPSAFAATGANCQTDVTINDFRYPPSKTKVVDILNRWVAACPLGGYPDECYEDVYCKAVKYGVNPGFAFTIWGKESSGSNYAYRSGVQDFGINTTAIPGADFEKQIDWFLTKIASVPSYIDSCVKADAVEYIDKYNLNMSPELLMWATKYYRGTCRKDGTTDPFHFFKEGSQYATDIIEIYSWFTGSTLTWPFKVTTDNMCNYSLAYTNTTYNSCDQKGTENPPTPIENRKWLAVTGIGNDGNVISPEVDLECLDSNGCTCIWNYNIKPGEYTKTANYGEICTVDGRVITEPESSPKCGTRAKTYKATRDDWPSGSTLCEIGTPKPTSVEFPNPGESVTWKCIDGDKKVTCEAKVSESNLECCLSNQSVSLVEKNSCKGKVLEDVEESNCVSKDKTIKILRGVNFIEGLEIVNYEDVPISTAKELITYSNNKIFLVAQFINNDWGKIVKYSEGSINGNDFNLTSGKVYLIISMEDINIEVKSVKVSNKEIDFSKLVGWQLVPSWVFEDVSYDTEDILLDKELSSYISHIGLWSNEISSFRYTVRGENSTIYGDSLNINQQEGVFVRVLEN